MKSTLKMILSLENGKTTTISLASPRKDITAADVTAFVADIVAKQAIIVNGSPVIAAKKIYIEDVDEKVLASAMAETLLTAVSAVGFPIVVTFYLLTTFQKSMDRLTAQLGELTHELTRLKQA